MPRQLIGTSRDREAATQRRLIDVMERRFGRRVAAEIRRESERLAEGYRATGSVPSADDEHEQRLRALYVDMADSAITTFGERVLSQGKSLGIKIEHKQEFAELFARLVQEWVAQEMIRQRITSVSATTRQQIIAQIERGEREGLGADEIARLIMENVPGISRQRGALIARTETHGAANNGANEAAKATGLDLQKEWVAIQDMRTRRFDDPDGSPDEFDHYQMDGQTADMDQPFLMPWLYGDPIPCMFPGDPVLPAGANVNCRCSLVHTVRGID